MNRAFLLVIAFCCLLGALGWMAWEPFPYSSQEGTANLAKADDWFRGMQEAGGFAWWSPNFQGGTSLVPLFGTFLTSAWLWMWVQALGMAAGIKFAMLACIPLAGASAFLLVRRLAGVDSMAFFGGVFYSLAPALWIRMLGVEHVVVVVGMALMPLACWAVFRLLQHPSVLSALLCAVACGLLALSYSKVAVLAAPVLAGLMLWGFWKHCGIAGWLKPRVGGTLIGGTFVLVALPNFPAARESGFAALFEFGPMAGWREAFASKSALQFFDRLGVISEGFRGDFAASTAAGAYYLGLVPLLALAVVLILRERIEASEGGERGFSILRLSLGLGFFAYWMSHGPFSVLSGTLRALEASGIAADFWPAVLWVVLVVQGWVIWVLFPVRMPLRWAAAVMVLAVYFLVPGFSLVSWLPIYSEMRAPFDFYQVAGVVWVCAAAGIAVVMLWQLIRGRAARLTLMAAAVAMVAWDFSGNIHWAKERALAPDVQSAFEDTAEFLRETEGAGSIFAVSGRYFYLLLPGMTGRHLVNEAFQNYLQQRNLAALAALAVGSPADFGEFLRMSGVRYIFVDRNDPDKPVEMVENFEGRFGRVFQNEHFELYEVPGTLAPAYAVRDAVLLASDELVDVAISFEVAGRDLAAIGPVLPGRSAGVIADGTLKLDEEFGAQKGEAFRALPEESVRFAGAGTVEVDLSGDGGWVVVPQAWHPDWSASSEEGSRIVYTAFGAFLALENDRPGTVTLRFSPPWWYGAALWISGLGWLVCLGTLAACVSPRVRAFLDRTNEPLPLVIERVPVRRPLAIIPTYNEAASIQTVIDGVLAADGLLAVLVVDDASPDGTADAVRAHAAFGKRIFLMERSGKLGLGSAYREGFRWAKENGHDACIEIDADMSHNPADIPRLLEALAQGNDAAIGSRYLDGLRVVNWPEHRLLVSAFGTQFVRFFTGLPLTDATSGFKALRVGAMSALDWSQIRADGYGFQVELHHALWRAGARMVEVPITFTERAEGTTKMTPGIAWEAMRRVIELSTLRKKT
jgi:dolichol-phosphate mannosyltransferase